MTQYRTHVMIDLETMATSPDAAVISLGAVKFLPSASPTTGQIYDTFYCRIDLPDAQKQGLRIDGDTVNWWLHPDREKARASLLEQDAVDLWNALDGFANWFGDVSIPVWGNGASFDNVILRTAYRAAGLNCPWKPSHDRCYRTVKSLAPQIEPVREGTHHNALDDALTQTRHLLEIARVLELRL